MNFPHMSRVLNSLSDECTGITLRRDHHCFMSLVQMIAQRHRIVSKEAAIETVCSKLPHGRQEDVRDQLQHAKHIWELLEEPPSRFYHAGGTLFDILDGAKWGVPSEEASLFEALLGLTLDPQSSAHISLEVIPYQHMLDFPTERQALYGWDDVPRIASCLELHVGSTMPNKVPNTIGMKMYSATFYADDIEGLSLKLVSHLVHMGILLPDTLSLPPSLEKHAYQVSQSHSEWECTQEIKEHTQTKWTLFARDQIKDALDSPPSPNRPKMM